jgi:hypothetical protein
MARLTNEFSWSVSRDQLFRTCRRAYYYTYYGSWGGWEPDAAPSVRQLYILKNLKTLEMWAGTIVHETIAEALGRYARKRYPIQAGELQARAREKLRSGWVEAVSQQWLTSPKKTNLHELYYGNGRSLPRERTERIRDRVNLSLTSFAESEALRELLAVSYLNWKPVDQVDSFLLDRLKVWCAVDFAFVDPAGQLRILDWKTGQEKPETVQTQLACYTFYAQEKWFAPPERVRVAGVFLMEKARVREYPVTPEVLVEAQDRILTSAADMRATLVDATANRAREEDFALSPADRPCRRCNYRAVCPRTAAAAEAVDATTAGDEDDAPLLG